MVCKCGTLVKGQCQSTAAPHAGGIQAVLSWTSNLDLHGRSAATSGDIIGVGLGAMGKRNLCSIVSHLLAHSPCCIAHTAFEVICLLLQLLCLDVHTSRPNLAATGSSGGSISLWDLRFQSAPLSLAGHETVAGDVWEVRPPCLFVCHTCNCEPSAPLCGVHATWVHLCRTSYNRGVE